MLCGLDSSQTLCLGNEALISRLTKHYWVLSVVVASSRSSKQSLSVHQCLMYLQHRRDLRLGRTCWRCQALQSEGWSVVGPVFPA